MEGVGFGVANGWIGEFIDFFNMQFQFSGELVNFCYSVYFYMVGDEGRCIFVKDGLFVQIDIIVVYKEIYYFGVCFWGGDDFQQVYVVGWVEEVGVVEVFFEIVVVFFQYYVYGNV